MYTASSSKAHRDPLGQVFAEPGGAADTESKQRLDLQKAVAACEQIPGHKKPMHSGGHSDLIRDD